MADHMTKREARRIAAMKAPKPAPQIAQQALSGGLKYVLCATQRAQRAPVRGPVLRRQGLGACIVHAPGVLAAALASVRVRIGTAERSGRRTGRDVPSNPTLDKAALSPASAPASPSQQPAGGSSLHAITRVMRAGCGCRVFGPTSVRVRPLMCAWAGSCVCVCVCECVR